jgi:molybdopterin-guanine dinucleotide biosynthesis protein A
MGRDKALVEVEGRAMAARVAAALTAAGCHPVVAVGGDSAHLAAIGLTVVADRWPGEGPLGAIITALLHTGAPTVVAACDLPWLDVSTIASLLPPQGKHGEPDEQDDLDEHDCVVAATTRDEPLCACWMPSALDHLRQCFDGGERAVHRALTGLRVRRVEVPHAALTNVNAPGDLPSP